MLNSVSVLDEKLIPAWQYPVSILDLLAARKLPLESALQGSSLFLSDAPFVNFRINPIQLNYLLENAQRLWRSPDFYFQLGHRLVNNGLGPLTDVLVEVQPLDHWIKYLCRFDLLISPHLSLRHYRINVNEYFLLFSSNHSKTLSPQHLRSLFVLLSHIIKHSNKSWRVEFYLTETKPKDVDLFYVHVAGKCYFSAPFNGVRIRQQPDNLGVASNNISTQVAINQCQEIIGTKRYVMSALSDLLWAKQNLNLNQAADLLQTSPATLKRKLSGSHSSFQTLTDQLKSEQAVIELLLKGTTLDQVSSNLNFHDSSNFRRALRRWTGLTPRSLKLTYQELFD